MTTKNRLIQSLVAVGALALATVGSAIPATADPGDLTHTGTLKVCSPPGSDTCVTHTDTQPLDPPGGIDVDVSDDPDITVSGTDLKPNAEYSVQWLDADRTAAGGSCHLEGDSLGPNVTTDGNGDFAETDRNIPDGAPTGDTKICVQEVEPVEDETAQGVTVNAV